MCVWDRSSRFSSLSFFLLAGKCRVMAAARNQRCRFNATPPFQKRNSKPIAESAVPEKKQKKTKLPVRKLGRTRKGKGPKTKKHTTNSHKKETSLDDFSFDSSIPFFLTFFFPQQRRYRNRRLKIQKKRSVPFRSSGFPIDRCCCCCCCCC